MQEVRRVLSDGNGIDEFLENKSRTEIDAASQRFEAAVPVFWKALDAIADSMTRVRVINSVYEVLGSALEMRSRVDHLRAPVWHDDRRRQKASRSRSEQAEPGRKALEDAIVKMAAELRIKEAQSEKFFERCKPLFSKHFGEDEKGHPRLTAFKAAAKRVQEREKRSETQKPT